MSRQHSTQHRSSPVVLETLEERSLLSVAHPLWVPANVPTLDTAPATVMPMVKTHAKKHAKTHHRIHGKTHHRIHAKHHRTPYVPPDIFGTWIGNVYVHSGTSASDNETFTLDLSQFSGYAQGVVTSNTIGSDTFIDPVNYSGNNFSIQGYTDNALGQTSFTLQGTVDAGGQAMHGSITTVSSSPGSAATKISGVWSVVPDITP